MSGGVTASPYSLRRTHSASAVFLSMPVAMVFTTTPVVAGRRLIDIGRWGVHVGRRWRVHDRRLDINRRWGRSGNIGSRKHPRSQPGNESDWPAPIEVVSVSPCRSSRGHTGNQRADKGNSRTLQQIVHVLPISLTKQAQRMQEIQLRKRQRRLEEFTSQSMDTAD